MKKLLETKEQIKYIDNKLLAISRRYDILLCYHNHYEVPTISIYKDEKEVEEYTLRHSGVDFKITIANTELVDEIISQIEEVLK